MSPGISRMKSLARSFVLDELHEGHPGISRMKSLARSFVLDELHEGHPGISRMKSLARSFVLDELHEGHPGISRMKSLARSFVWWPGLDKSLELKVKTCNAWQRSQNLPAVAPIQPWEWPECPWSRLHIDYAGPLLGHMLELATEWHSPHHLSTLSPCYEWFSRMSCADLQVLRQEDP